MNHIRSSSTLLVTMLLLSACRTAHKVAKEEAATHTSETSQSSVAFNSSFANLFSALSLRADSIVLWMLPSETEAASTSYEEDSSVAPVDTNLCLPTSGSTAHSKKPRHRTSTPKVAKVLISGLNVSSVQTEEKVTSSLARDSLSARESGQSSMTEKEESKPPNNIGNLIFAFLLIAGIGFIASVFKSK